MDWELAIEKNHGALKRVLAMLVAMAGMGSSSSQPEPSLPVAPPSVLSPVEGPDISPTRGEISSGAVGSTPSTFAIGETRDASVISPLVGEMSGPSTRLRTEGGNVEHSPASGLPNTLPRHLHRFILRLLRPAEAATRRLIIIAARGIVVKLPKVYERKPRPKKPPLNRKNGYGTNIVIRPGPLPEWIKQFVPKRSPRLSLPLLDPMKRFGIRRRYAKPAAMPRIRVLGDDGPIVPFFRRPEPLPPPPPTPDDPLDAASIHRRLKVLQRALDDLPKQALRMARWQARRDARLAGERENNRAAPFSVAPPSVLSLVEGPDISPTRGEISSGGGGSTRSAFAIGEARDASVISPLVGEMSGPSTRLRTEGGAKERDGREANLADLGLTPEAIALVNRSKQPGRPAQPSTATQTAKPHRFHRTSPMRPGRPPGWRKRQNHEVYEVLNELHGLAVWASERRDSS